MDCRDLRQADEASAETPRVRILAAVSDLLFVAKISAAARQVGAPAEFFGNAEALQRSAVGPAIILVDLNHASLDPLALIRNLKQDPATREVPVIGFVSHVQHERKREAERAGCDLVLPRSVFSQNLNELLRQRSCHI
jgi:CheY-like chemotaxis protein